jgi:large subunit ribosomal protein L29
MKASELRAKSIEDLAEDLLVLRREQFNMRMQQVTGQMARPHEHGRVKKDVARVKTVMAELKKAAQAPKTD